MKYCETGFRAAYKQFCCFSIDAITKDTIKNYPGVENSDHVLTYGYYDREVGFSFEVIACAKKEDNGFVFEETSIEDRCMIRAEVLKDQEFFHIFDDDGDLAKRYKDKLKVLEAYNPENVDIEESRKMGFLDESRDPIFIDDVLVYLYKDGLQTEGCWARIIGLGQNYIMGNLLNEPNQNFGYHQGDEIGFGMQKTEDGKQICVSDMNIGSITREELEDGQLLKNAIIKFNNERTEDNVFEIFQILRDSYVWIPCNCIQSERDIQAMKDMLEKAGDDLEKLKGVTFSNQDEMRMVPDILQNGEDFFFPVFSSAEEMGEYGNGFSKIEKHFLEALVLARNNEKNVKGIVVNAFSDPYVLPIDLFDMFEKIKSRVVEN